MSGIQSVSAGKAEEATNQPTNQPTNQLRARVRTDEELLEIQRASDGKLFKIHPFNGERIFMKYFPGLSPSSNLGELEVKTGHYGVYLQIAKGEKSLGQILGQIHTRGLGLLFLTRATGLSLQELWDRKAEQKQVIQDVMDALDKHFPAES